MTQLKRQLSFHLLKELGFTALPLLGFLFLESTSRLFENAYLCRQSLEGFNASFYAFTFLNFFQKLSTTFVNRNGLFGDKRRSIEIGNYIWQAMWASFFFCFLAILFGLLIEKWIVKTPDIGEMASSYFSISMMGLILFPCVSILISFFRATGKKEILLIGRCLIFFVSIALSTVLITHYAVKGAAVAFSASKLIFFLVLFCCFLSRSNRESYGTNMWAIDWDCILKYILRPNTLFIGFVFNLIAWATLNICMIRRGGPYLTSLSIGSAITFFSMCSSNSIYYTFTDAFQKYKNMYTGEILKLGVLISFVLGSLLAAPCLFFQKSVLSLFFTELSMAPGYLQQVLYWAGVWIFTTHLYTAPLAFLSSLGKGNFYSKVRLGSMFLTLLQAIYFIRFLDFQPVTYWIILCVENLILISSISWSAYFFYRKIAATSVKYE